MNRLRSLEAQGQSVWLDFLARRFTAEGGLQRLVDQDGLGGVTSNPSIFEKAIAEGSDYDAALNELESHGDSDAMALYERLAIQDIQRAADVLHPVYVAAHRRDGFVSLEVSPYLAWDGDATVAEAQRLWRAVDRENLMIKVPATDACLPAIRQLIGEGINVNVTLLFGQDVYVRVAEAYLAGLEDLVARGGDPRAIASVASMFVSRIDVAVEALVTERLGQTQSSGEREALQALGGKVAIANAKLTYQHYKRLFAGPRWTALQVRGAGVQRLLWASTGRKNPAYSDVLYVEELIAPETVNTMPPGTMDAFRDHGRARASLEADIPQVQAVMEALERGGISLAEVTGGLVTEGVNLFAAAFDELLGAVARKRAILLGDALNSQSWRLPESLAADVHASLETWRRDGTVRRLWARDPSVWTGKDEAGWLGWLDIVGAQQAQVERLATFAETLEREAFTHILLLGMGGSSLGPEVLAQTFGRLPGRPELLVLDSTDPAQIRSFESRIDLRRTLFVVSSKSGSTLEPNILMQYFLQQVKAAIGVDQAGSRFMAITDPGSSLQAVAEREQFRHVAFGEPSIGGRYSVLSEFGLAPGAAMGLNLGKLLAVTQTMVRACAASAPAPDNPGVVLGTILGVLGRAGRDKVTIITSPGIADFGAWLEQLLAESTGKHGAGLIPIEGEPLGEPTNYGTDRLFTYVRLTPEADPRQDAHVAALERAGQPVVRIGVADRYQIGQEFFRWEFATAVAGAILALNPFDQPDVEASKIKTRHLTDAYERGDASPPEPAFLEEGGLKLFADPANEQAIVSAGDGTLLGTLRAHLGRLARGDYCALLAYLERNRPHRDALQTLRMLIRDRKRVATCVGFGPRFLHSTGQAYKGGPNTGVFLQITCDDADDLSVPGHRYTFGVVKAAEAQGDFDVLAERGRRLLRVHLAGDVGAGLASLTDLVRLALE
jgi:transaldolase/glucose-6-phosphate isomerase